MSLFYTKTHEWVSFINETSARVGITNYAQEAMGDLVFINLPEEGDAVRINEAFADVESVKAVEDILSPLEGVVSTINEELLDAPELINKDPYGSWLIEVSDITNKGELIDEESYKKFLSEGR